jgi:hypothetical protein
MSGVPTLDQLTAVTGEVKSVDVELQRSRRSTKRLLGIRVEDKPVAFYSERLPDYELLVLSITPGDHITMWVDTGNNTIWQVKEDDTMVVSYEQVAEAERTNNRNNGFIGLGFFVSLVRMRSSGSAPPPEDAPPKPAD